MKQPIIMAEQDSEQPLPLDYGVPEPRDPMRNVRRGMAFMGGAILSLLIELACLFVWGVANLHLELRAGDPDPPVTWIGPSICSTLGFGFLCLMVWSALRNRTPWFLAGLLVGGIGGLLLFHAATTSY